MAELSASSTLPAYYSYPEDRVPQRSTIAARDFVDHAKWLDKEGHADAALDLIYDSIDELLHSRQFALCASLLGQLDVSACSRDILLALLTATLPAKTRIPTRASFLRRVEAELRRRGGFQDDLLQGLA